MTLDELTNMIPEVRIINSTYLPCDKTRAMIGRDFKVERINYTSNTIAVSDENNCFFFFNLSDVQFLTPLSFKEKRIAIGDDVMTLGKYRKVYGFQWVNGEYLLNTVIDDDFTRECFNIANEQITEHRTTTTDTKAEECIKYLTEKGFIKDGKILV